MDAGVCKESSTVMVALDTACSAVRAQQMLGEHAVRSARAVPYILTFKDDMSDLSGDPSRMLSNLERATAPKEFFLLAAFTLLIDFSIDQLHGTGLIFYTQHPEAVKYSFLLEVFLIFVGYSFLTSLITPAVSYLMTSLLLAFASPLWSKLQRRLAGNPTAGDRLPPHGHVALSQLSRKVHEERDTGYYFKLLEREEEAVRANLQEAHSRRLFAAAAFFAFALDFGFGGAGSLTHAALAYATWSAWLVWIALIVAGLNAFGFVFEDYRTHWVFCPPLAEELTPDRPPVYLRGLTGAP